MQGAIPAWSPTMQGDIQRLEKVQIKAVSKILGMSGFTYEEKLSVIKLGLDILEKRLLKIDTDIFQRYKIQALPKFKRKNSSMRTWENGNTRQAQDVTFWRNQGQT